LNRADRADKLGDIEKLVTKFIEIELTLITTTSMINHNSFNFLIIIIEIISSFLCHQPHQKSQKLYIHTRRIEVIPV